MARPPRPGRPRGTPGGNEPNAAGGGATAGGGARGGGGQWGTGGLNFDTRGIEAFKAAIHDARKEVEAFWAPFKDTTVASRKTEDFFSKLKANLKEVSELGGAAAPGGQPGKANPRLGGTTTMPKPPSGRDIVAGRGTAFTSAFRAARGGGAEGVPGQQSLGGATMAGARAAVSGGTGMSWSQAALVTVGTLQRYAGRQEGEAIGAQSVATLVSVGQGRNPAGGWSRQYRDDVMNTLMTSRTLGANIQERTAAAEIAYRSGLQVAGPGGRGLNQTFQTAGQMAAMTGTDLPTQMQVQANMQQAPFVNVTRMLGIQVRPGGNQKDAITVYKQLRDYIFRPLGRNPTKEEVRLTLRTPGTPAYVLATQIFQGDQQGMEAFITWVENSAAAGKDIAAGAGVGGAPGAKTVRQGQREREEQAGRARAETYEGLLQGLEDVNNVARNLHDTFADLLGALGPLPAAFGRLAGLLNGLPGMGGGGGGGGGGILNTAAGFVLGKGALGLGARALGMGGGAAGGGLLGGARALAGKAGLAGALAVGGNLLGQGISSIGRKDGDANDLAKAAGTIGKWTAGGAAAGSVIPGVGTALGAAGGLGVGAVHAGGRAVIENVDKIGNVAKGAWNSLFGDPVGTWGWRPFEGGIGDPPPAGGSGAVTGLRGKGQTSGMNSDFLGRLSRMFTDNPKLTLNSGFRSSAEQAVLYQKYLNGTGNLAAPPGRSKHEKGLAADVGPPSEYGWMAQNIDKYGLALPIRSKEPWHVEPSGGVSGGAVGAVDAAAAASSGGEDAGSPGGGGGTAANISGGLAGVSLFGIGGPSLVGGSGGYKGVSAGGGRSAAGIGAGGGGGGGAPVTGVPTAGAISVEQALRLAKAAGFSGEALKTVVAIAMGESGLRADAKGDISLQDAKWGPSVGLWQVRTVKAETGKGSNRDINKLLADPNFQAKAAWEISGGGRNWTPWTIWKTGAYKQHLPAVTQAMAQSGVGDAYEPGLMGGSAPGGVTISAGSGSAGGGPTVIVQRAEFKVEIARGTPEEAERFARYVMETLGDRDRLIKIGGGRG